MPQHKILRLQNKPFSCNLFYTNHTYYLPFPATVHNDEIITESLEAHTHDLLEHLNGFANSIYVADEIQALGSSFLGRVETGLLQSVYYAGEEMVCSEVADLYISYPRSSLQMKPGITWAEYYDFCNEYRELMLTLRHELLEVVEMSDGAITHKHTYFIERTLQHFAAGAIKHRKLYKDVCFVSYWTYVVNLLDTYRAPSNITMLQIYLDRANGIATLQPVTACETFH